MKKYLVSANQLKQETITELNAKLVGSPNIMAKVNPATYEAIVNTISKLIDKNNEGVKCRRKTGKEDTEEV